MAQRGDRLRDRASSNGSATAVAGLEHLDTLHYYEQQEALALDQVTVRNLELIEPIGDDSSATLVSALDETATGMGARLLRSWILRPEIALDEIEARLDAVEQFRARTVERDEIFSTLERGLRSRTPHQPRHHGHRRPSRPPRAAQIARADSRAARISGRGRAQPPLHESPSFMTRSMSLPTCAKASPAQFPMNHRRCRPIPESFAPDSTPRSMNCAISAAPASKPSPRWKNASANAPESPRSKSASIKSSAITSKFPTPINDRAPADYDRKQTLVGAERFTSPELKEYERKVLDADERILEIERRLYAELREQIAHEAPRLRRTAAAIAQLDVLVNFARIAAAGNFTRPTFTEEQPGERGDLLIAGGRHPVIERLLSARGERFVPNDLFLDDKTQSLLLITGPNMGGKSTYLRQTALIVILAQIGSFVPATQAKLPIVDRIFTRIGASDNLARGRSTFLGGDERSGGDPEYRDAGQPRAAR